MKYGIFAIALSVPCVAFSQGIVDFGKVESVYYFDSNGGKCDTEAFGYMEFGPEGMFFIQNGANIIAGSLLGERKSEQVIGSQFAAQLDKDFGTDVLAMITVSAPVKVTVETDGGIYTFDNVKQCEK